MNFNFISDVPSLPVRVVKRNNRERTRIGVINSTFKQLRQFFPRKKDDRRMSKLEILHRTINYIQDLTQALNTDEITSPRKLADAVLPKRPRARRNGGKAAKKLLKNEITNTEEDTRDQILRHPSSDNNICNNYRIDESYHVQQTPGNHLSLYSSYDNPTTCYSNPHYSYGQQVYSPNSMSDSSSGSFTSCCQFYPGGDDKTLHNMTGCSGLDDQNLVDFVLENYEYQRISALLVE